MEPRLLLSTAPFLSIDTSSARHAREGGAIRSFIISRTGSTAAPLTYHMLVGGTATNGVDYGVIGPAATIPAGETSMLIKVRPVDDAKVESTESVTLTLLADPAYSLGSVFASTIRIADNDAIPSTRPSVSVSVQGGSASESGRTRLFTITRDGTLSSSLIVHLQMGGTATNGVDYGKFGSAVTIPANQSSLSLRLRPFDDDKPESTESATLNIVPSSDYTIANASATTRILDNDTAPTAPFPTSLSWSAKASAPVGRGEAETAVYGSRIYLFGGYTDFSATDSSRCDFYDTATNTWHAVAAMPVGVTHAGQATVDAKVYLAGGYTGGPGGSQTFATNQVQVYNLATDSWSTITSLPDARGGGAMAAVGHVLHFFGGADINRHDSTSHWAFDLDNPSAGWVANAPMLTPRNHMGAVTLNGKIYAVGGQQNQDQAESPQAALEVYNPTSNQWSTLAPLPFGRSHIASATVIVDNRIVTLGGETTYQNAINNVTAYDPNTNTWTDLTPLPVSHASGVAAYIDGAFYYTTGDVTTGTYKATPA